MQALLAPSMLLRSQAGDNKRCCCRQEPARLLFGKAIIDKKPKQEIA